MPCRRPRKQWAGGQSNFENHQYHQYHPLTHLTPQSISPLPPLFSHLNILYFTPVSPIYILSHPSHPLSPLPLFISPFHPTISKISPTRSALHISISQTLFYPTPFSRPPSTRAHPPSKNDIISDLDLTLPLHIYPFHSSTSPSLPLCNRFLPPPHLSISICPPSLPPTYPASHFFTILFFQPTPYFTLSFLHLFLPPSMSPFCSSAQRLHSTILPYHSRPHPPSHHATLPFLKLTPPSTARWNTTTSPPRPTQTTP